MLVSESECPIFSNRHVLFLSTRNIQTGEGGGKSGWGLYSKIYDGYVNYHKLAIFSLGYCVLDFVRVEA